MQKVFTCCKQHDQQHSFPVSPIVHHFLQISESPLGLLADFPARLHELHNVVKLVVHVACAPEPSQNVEGFLELALPDQPERRLRHSSQVKAREYQAQGQVEHSRAADRQCGTDGEAQQDTRVHADAEDDRHAATQTRRRDLREVHLRLGAHHAAAHAQDDSSEYEFL